MNWTDANQHVEQFRAKLTSTATSQTFPSTYWIVISNGLGQGQP